MYSFAGSGEVHWKVEEGGVGAGAIRPEGKQLKPDPC